MQKRGLKAVFKSSILSFLSSYIVVATNDLISQATEPSKHAAQEIDEDSPQQMEAKFSNVLIHFKPEKESIPSDDQNEHANESKTESTESNESFEAFQKKAEENLELVKQRLTKFESDLTESLTNIFGSATKHLERAQLEYEQSVNASLPTLPSCEMRSKGSQVKTKTSKPKKKEQDNALVIFFGTAEQFAKTENGGILVEFTLEGSNFRLKNPFSLIFAERFNVNCIPTAVILYENGNKIAFKKGVEAYDFW